MPVDIPHRIGLESDAINANLAADVRCVGPVWLPSGKPEKDVLEMDYAAALDFDAFLREHSDFFLNRDAL